jgi:hypothetical protein
MLVQLGGMGYTQNFGKKTLLQQQFGREKQMG